MSRFVFFETPRAVLRSAAPSYAELAALKMQWALVKLALKAGITAISRAYRPGMDVLAVVGAAMFPGKIIPEKSLRTGA